MNFLIILTVILSLNLSVNALFINPDILSAPAANRIICQSPHIENRGSSYLQCPPQSNIRILSAIHLPTKSKDLCPEQFILPVVNQPLAATACPNPIQNNVTTLVASFCNFQTSCAFQFNQIVTEVANGNFGLQCLDISGTSVTHIPLIQTYFNVTYRCDGPRQRFRPFSNKRYDSKFSPSAFHNIRHPSNNRFVA